jgi:hypothetical protein
MTLLTSLMEAQVQERFREITEKNRGKTEGREICLVKGWETSTEMGVQMASGEIGGHTGDACSSALKWYSLNRMS